MEVIDVSTFDKQKEKAMRTEKINKKIAEKEINTEFDKKYKTTHVHNPFIHQKSQKSNEELEKSKIVSASIKNETLYEKYKREKAKSEVVNIQSQKDMVLENLSYELAISEFANTEPGAIAKQHLNNLIASYYSNNLCKREIFEKLLMKNPIIQRNNERIVYNLLNYIPLSLQMPLFIGLEILNTEETFKRYEAMGAFRVMADHETRMKTAQQKADIKTQFEEVEKSPSDEENEEEEEEETANP